MFEAFVLNPGRKRKAKRSKAKASRRSSKRSRAARKGARTRAAKKAARRASARKGRSRRGRKNSRPRARQRKTRRSRRGSIMVIKGRRLNRGRTRSRGRSGGFGLSGGLLTVPQVLPFKLPLPGILGTVANGVIQGVAGGVIVFGGYVLGGKVVDMVWTKADAAAGDNVFKQNWARPLLFAGVAGLFGTGAAMFAPKGKRALFAVLASAGPGLRAAAGVLAALIPADSTGVMGDIKTAATALGDFIQVGDSDPLNPDDLGDYIQVGAYEEAGLGIPDDLYQAGMGQEVTDDMDEATVGI